MIRRKLFSAVALTSAAAIASVGFGAADAATIMVKATDNGTALNITPNMTTTGALTYVASDGSFSMVWGGASGEPITEADDFNTNTIDVKKNGSAAKTLVVSFTQVGLTTPAFGFVGTSSISSTYKNITGSINTYVGTGAYSTAHLISSEAVASTGTGTNGSILPTFSPFIPTGTFSETIIYTLNFGTGASSATATGNIDANTAAVPESATWAMMLVGFGGMGSVLRSNRRSKKAFNA